MIMHYDVMHYTYFFYKNTKPKKVKNMFLFTVTAKLKLKTRK